MPLTYEQAERALEAAVAKAVEMSIAVAIAVVDDKGGPVALARMNGARYFTGEVAIGKAKASALFGNPSGRMAQNIPPAIAGAVTEITGGRAIFWQGAVPIKSAGELVGAIGASGSTSENDEVVSQAGADAVLAAAASA
ncbi:MAG: GlcG/HbpS family heme-binding protein [Dehalococcoidia bacterium]